MPGRCKNSTVVDGDSARCTPCKANEFAFHSDLYPRWAAQIRGNDSCVKCPYTPHAEAICDGGLLKFEPGFWHSGLSWTATKAQYLSFFYADYNPEHWYWEVVECFRKLALTGVALFFGEQGSLLQTSIAIGLMMLYVPVLIRMRPYALPSDNNMAQLVNVGLLFVLFTALLLKVKTSFVSTGRFGLGYTESTIGYLLILVAVIVVAAWVLTLVDDVWQFNRRQSFRYKCNGCLLTMPKLDGNRHLYHAFISHSQQDGGDQVAHIKKELEKFIDTISIFTDVAAGQHERALTKKSQLYSAIEQSEVFIVFLTKSFFTRKWCVKELQKASATGKHIILVLDSDTRHGGMTVGELVAYSVGQRARAAADAEQKVSNLWNQATLDGDKECAALCDWVAAHVAADAAPETPGGAVRIALRAFTYAQAAGEEAINVPERSYEVIPWYRYAAEKMVALQLIAEASLGAPAWDIDPLHRKLLMPGRRMSVARVARGRYHVCLSAANHGSVVLKRKLEARGVRVYLPQPGQPLDGTAVQRCDAVIVLSNRCEGAVVAKQGRGVTVVSSELELTSNAAYQVDLHVAVGAGLAVILVHECVVPFGAVQRALWEQASAPGAELEAPALQRLFDPIAQSAGHVGAGQSVRVPVSLMLRAVGPQGATVRTALGGKHGAVAQALAAHGRGGLGLRRAAPQSSGAGVPPWTDEVELAVVLLAERRGLMLHESRCGDGGQVSGEGGSGSGVDGGPTSPMSSRTSPTCSTTREPALAPLLRCLPALREPHACGLPLCAPPDEAAALLRAAGGGGGGGAGGEGAGFLADARVLAALRPLVKWSAVRAAGGGTLFAAGQGGAPSAQEWRWALATATARAARVRGLGSVGPGATHCGDAAGGGEGACGGGRADEGGQLVVPPLPAVAGASRAFAAFSPGAGGAVRLRLLPSAGANGAAAVVAAPAPAGAGLGAANVSVSPLDAFFFGGVVLGPPGLVERAAYPLQATLRFASLLAMRRAQQLLEPFASAPGGGGARDALLLRGESERRAIAATFWLREGAVPVPTRALFRVMALPAAELWHRAPRKARPLNARVKPSRSDGGGGHGVGGQLDPRAERRALELLLRAVQLADGGGTDTGRAAGDAGSVGAGERCRAGAFARFRAYRDGQHRTYASMDTVEEPVVAAELPESTNQKHREKRCGRPSPKQAVILMLVMAFITFLVVDSVGAGHIKDLLDSFMDWVEDNVALGAVVYMFVYAMCTVLLIPGSVLTIGAGAVFARALGQGKGILVAVLVVWTGAMVGACCSFVLGRHFIRDSVSAWYRKFPVMNAVDAAVTANGLKVVALLRLSPVVPFAVFNYGTFVVLRGSFARHAGHCTLIRARPCICTFRPPRHPTVMGLTSVQYRHYWVGTAVGMVPGICAFVFIGSTLTSVASGSEEEEGSGSTTVRIVALVVGAVATIIAVVLISKFASRELRKALRNANSVNANGGGDVEAGSASGESQPMRCVGAAQHTDAAAGEGGGGREAARARARDGAS
eukprot:g2182.t1